MPQFKIDVWLSIKAGFHDVRSTASLCLLEKLEAAITVNGGHYDDLKEYRLIKIYPSIGRSNI